MDRCRGFSFLLASSDIYQGRQHIETSRVNKKLDLKGLRVLHIRSLAAETALKHERPHEFGGLVSSFLFIHVIPLSVRQS